MWPFSEGVVDNVGNLNHHKITQVFPKLPQKIGKKKRLKVPKGGGGWGESQSF